MFEPSEVTFFEQTIDEMKKSDGQIRVGAVLVHKGRVVATGNRANGLHAERAAIVKANAQGIPLRETVLYTTLEPCVEVEPEQKKKSCADLIIESEIPEVVIGRYDPNPHIYRKGWRALRNAGIRLRDFPERYRQLIDQENDQFMDFFTQGTGPTGGAKINHQNGASFCVQFSNMDERHITIRWGLCGVDAAYIQASDTVSVAHALYAQDFEEIDDPSAFKFGHSARIGIGEVGIFRGPEGFILVRPTEVHSGPNYGNEDYFVKFRFKVVSN